MARTWRYRWWVPPLAVVAAVLLVVLVQLVMGTAAVVLAVATGVEGTGDSIFGAPVPDLAFQLIVITTMTPIVVFVAWLVQRRPVGTLFSVTGRLRVRWLLCCTLLAVPAMAVALGVLYGLTLATSPGTPFIAPYAGGPDFALTLVLLGLLVPFQASAEEIALRGFLMQAVGSIGAGPEERRGASVVSRFLRTPLPGIVISGCVFTLLHDYFGWGLLDVAVFGIAMAWLTWYTGGLEAAIGLHVVHNLAAFAISAYEGTLDQAATGGGSWQGVVSTTAEVTVYIAVVVWLARRMKIERAVPGNDHPAAAGPGLPAPHGQWPPAQPVPPGPGLGPEVAPQVPPTPQQSAPQPGPGDWPTAGPQLPAPGGTQHWSSPDGGGTYR
ncbi:CPBP family intramembrane metalloprotease [Streptomonospora sp. S1-112]|uniref:CPBP family intramembrane metalloprotease n=1 Tax=Streptomonospora mangrovi TaxID=2883123 RepID=A0A9X3NG90_9ACTN|nr:type II CAAX endopeptidase family protein [Streptomonospora mangrovi]MDA0563002.1 CPBP family intramembrane metalloprotease [Streptomonospora mangrovi]